MRAKSLFKPFMRHLSQPCHVSRLLFISGGLYSELYPYFDHIRTFVTRSRSCLTQLPNNLNIWLNLTLAVTKVLSSNVGAVGFHGDGLFVTERLSFLNLETGCMFSNYITVQVSSFCSILI